MSLESKNFQAPNFDGGITTRQAYLGMFEYLRRYYERGHSDEIGGMLGGLLLLQDGSSADPAALYEFVKALEAVVQADHRGGYQGANFRLL